MSLRYCCLLLLPFFQLHAIQPKTPQESACRPNGKASQTEFWTNGIPKAIDSARWWLFQVAFTYDFKLAKNRIK